MLFIAYEGICYQEWQNLGIMRIQKPKPYLSCLPFIPQIEGIGPPVPPLLAVSANL